MLATFRKGANGIFAKILLGFLMLSFAAWGIGDIFRSSNAPVIATIGGAPIYATDLDNRIKQMQQQFGELTAEVAESLPVRLQILNQMVNSRLLLKEAESIGIDFSKDALAENIASDPNLAGEDGAFSAEQFQNFLQQINVSEAVFLQQYANDLKLSLIEQTIAGSLPIPNYLLDLYYRIRYEERSANLILVDKRDIQAPAEPNSDELKAYYEAHKSEFQLPEFRTLRTVSFDSKTVEKLLKINPTNDELRTYYESNLSAFETPEKRKLSKLEFETEAGAKAAYDALYVLPSGKKRLKDYASAHDTVLNPEDIHIGELTENELPEKVAASAFSAEKGTLTPPVETPFGWQVYQIDDIIQAGTIPFEKAEADIRENLMSEQLDSELEEMSNALDDAIAGGATLEEALKETGLSALDIRSFGPVAADGTTADGKKPDMTPLIQEMVTLAFSLELNDISPITLTADNSYYVVELTAIDPASEQPLDAVKNEVTEGVMQEKTQTALKEKAHAIASELQKVENPVVAARDMGLSLHTTGKIQRTDDVVSGESQIKDELLSADFVQALFRLKPSDVTTPYQLPSGKYAVGIVGSIYPATEKEPAAFEQLRRELSTQMQSELLNAYLESLRVKFPVEIKMEELNTDAD